MPTPTSQRSTTKRVVVSAALPLGKTIGMMDLMGLWMLLGLLIVALVIGLAVFVAIRAGQGPSRRTSDGAHAELDRRFAAGDIDAAEHRRRVEALGR